MGYNLTIGELEIQKNPEDGLDSDCIRFSAKGMHFDHAPAFGEPTDHTNERWPSYSAWSDFARNAGLYHVLFDSMGRSLVGGHPGVRLVTKELCDAVENALGNHKKKYPDARATFEGEKEECATLCRLIWLDFWLKWAYENCETPVLANS